MLKWNHLEQYEWQGKLLEADLRLLEEKGMELARIVKDTAEGTKSI